MANNKFQVKRTSTSGLLPNTTNSSNNSYIDAGELAINLTDKKMVSSNGSVSFEIGANLTSLNVATTLAAGNTTITGFANVTSTIQGGAGLTLAGAASGITTLAAGNTTLTGSLTLSDRINQTGTVTNAGGYIQLGGQLTSSQTGQQNMFTMQSQVSPQGAGTLSALYGLLFLPTIVSSANNITDINPVFARVDSLASYTGAVGTINTIQAGTPSWGSATAITTVNQFLAQNATATNVFGFKSFISAAAGKWNFYAQGTANNYMAGGLGIGTTSLTQPLTVTGNAAISANLFVTNSINAASYTVGTAFIANSTGAYHTGTMNAASYTVGTNFIANSIGITTTGYANIATTLAAGNTTITGSMTVSGNLTVNGTVITLTGNNLSITDNMLYLNNGIEATITNVVANGTYIIFTANNNYSAGWDVDVTGVSPSIYNGTYSNIFAANATTFTVASANTGAFVSSGTARGKTDSNPDLGFAAAYNDGTYHHAGFFRDASDGIWKVFDNYDPEPDASVFIDTSNNSFHLADFWANTARFGNTTVYSTINTTSFSGTSNNSTYFNGYTWAAPGALGTTTVNTAAFSTLTVSTSTYGEVYTSQFASVWGTAAGANPYSIMQVRSNDGTSGMGMQAYAGLYSKIYTNDGFVFTTGATLRDKDYPTGGTTRATLDSTGLTVTGIANVSSTLAAGNTTITGFANVNTTLQVGTNTATFGTAAYFVANGNLGIGINTPPQQLAIGNSTDQIGLGQSGTVTTLYFGVPSTGSGGIARISYDRSVGNLTFTGNTIASPTTSMTVTSQGQVGIGTTSPAHPLHVAGNTLVTSNMGIGTGISASASLAVSKNITGAATSTGISQNGTVLSDVTTAARGFFNTLNIANNSTFTTTSYSHYGTINSRPVALNSTISNLYGFQADNTLVSGVINFGFLGQIPASSVSTISNVSLTTNVVTVTTAAAHAFWPGQSVVVAATTTTSINGTFTVLTCPSTTTFTYALVLADIVSTADTGSSTVSSNRWNAYMQGTAPNYFAGQTSIGTTNLTNGYLAVSVTQSSTIAMAHIAGTNQWTGTTPIGLNNSPTLIGTSAMTNVYGIVNAPVGSLAAGATVGTFGGININPNFNSATTPTSYWGAVTQLLFGAAALGGTITNVAGYASIAPSFSASATTNITTYAGFRASSVANGAAQAITNIYAFYGLQDTSATSNAYNLFMSGTAKNYLAGNTGIGNTMPNATLAVTGTANVSGAVNFASTLNVIGNLTTNGSINTTTATGKVIIGTDSGGSISMGRIDGTASAPYIDFNSGATAVDYDARISVGAGTGAVGNAVLTIAARTLAAGNTAITGTVDITDPINAATATPTLRTINGAYYFAYIPRAGGGSYNDLVVANDSAVIFSNGTQGYGGLTISPWAAGIAGGIRLAASAGVVTVGITGATTITGSANVSTTLAAGNTTVTGFVNATSSVNSAILAVGTSFVANTLGAYHTGTVNAAALSVGTAFVANTTQITIGTGIELSSNGSVGTSGQVLTSNGASGSPYWSTVGSSTYNPYRYNITANTTIITGADALGQTLTYTAGYEEVFRNGSKLIPILDYARSNTTAITLTANAVNNDHIEVIAFNAYNAPIIGITNTTTTSTTSAWIVDSFSATTYRSAKYQIQVTDNTNGAYQLSELSLVHDGTNVQFTEFGAVYTGASSIGTASANIVGSTVNVIVTPTTANSTINTIRTSIGI